MLVLTCTRLLPLIMHHHNDQRPKGQEYTVCAVVSEGSHRDCDRGSSAPACAAGGPQLCRQLTSTSEGIRSCQLLCCALAAKRASPRKQERHPACYGRLLFDCKRSSYNVSVVTYFYERGSLTLYALSEKRHASTINDSLAALVNVNRATCREAALSTR